MKKLVIITLAILLVTGSMAYGQKRLDYNGYIRSAKIYLDLTPKDYKKAAEMLQAAIDYYPDEPPIEAHYILGLIYSEKRLYKEMREEFNYVLDKCQNATDKKVKKVCEKGQFETFVDTILFSSWLSQYNTGVNALKRARSGDTCSSIEDETEKAYCDSNTMKDYQEALEDFQISTMILPDSAHGWINIGLVYYSTGRTDEAMAAYRKAITINPRDVSLLSNIFSIFFNEQQYDSACHYGGMLAAIEDLDPASKADILYNMAFAMNANKNDDSAIALLDQVLEITPESVDALYNRGAFKVKKSAPLASRLGRLSDSLDINEKKYKPIIDSLGEELKAAYRSAVTDFEQVLALQPDNMDALDWLGRAYFIIEDWEKAKGIYDKILEIDPENEDAWCQLLLLYLKANDAAMIKEAKKHCTRYK